MKVLLSGASGFIGKHISSLFNKKKYEVIPFKGDVTKIDNWKRNLKNIPDVVVHLAGVRTEEDVDFEINSNGTKNLFKAVENTKKFPRKIIIASSEAVYLSRKPPFKEDIAVFPLTVYGKSKLKAEEISLKYSKKLKIPIVILRLSTVIGPGIREKSNMSGPLLKWTQLAVENKDIIVFQDGKQTRDPIHVDDVSDAILFILKKDIEGVFNIAGGEKIALLSLAKMIKKLTNSKSKIIINNEFSPNDPRHVYSSIAKIKRLGWKPKREIKDAVYEYVHSVWKSKSENSL